jgi:hypothetical protein
LCFLKTAKELRWLVFSFFLSPEEHLVVEAECPILETILLSSRLIVQIVA